jgi:DNA sulfur modification protein DndD
MKINSLTLYNFGFYYNKNTFNLNIANSENNIILIGGENGAGKSTILEAIKLALYGSLFMGFKTNADSYLDYIQNRINYNAIKEDQNDVYIKINFDLQQDGDKSNYELKRRWDINDSSEKLLIKKDGNKLSDKKINEFNNYIRKLYSPELFDFFLFDGEKITNTLYNDDFHNKLKKITTKVFNLSILNTLKEDIKHVIKYKTDNISYSDKETDYIKAKEEYEETKEKINKVKIQLNETNNNISNITNRREKLNKEFKLNGGLLAKERDKILKKISLLKEKKNSLKNKIQELNETILPFLPAKSILPNILGQLKKEKEYFNYININNKLNNKNTKNKILKQTSFEKNVKNQSNLVNNVLTAVNETLKPNFDIENFNPIHKLSPNEEDNLKNIIYKIKNINNEKIKYKINEINKLNNKILKLNKSLEENKKNTDLEDILTKIENCNEKIGQMKITKENKEAQLNSLNEELIELEKIYNKKYKNLVNTTKEKSIPVITNKLKNIIDKFIYKQTKKKLKRVENNFIKIINKLFSSENYIKKININPETFEIKLFSKNNDPLKNLSSGEQQLVILALLWSLLDTSKQKFPIIFDTLLGRIDNKHRKNIIQNLINKTNEQIIILSTDSEINEDFYNDIRPYIQKEYLLSKEKKLKHKAVIKNKKYFFEGENNG